MTTKTWKVGDGGFGVGYDYDTGEHFGGPCDVLEVRDGFPMVRARVHGLESHDATTPVFETQDEAEIAAQRKNVHDAWERIYDLLAQVREQYRKRDRAAEQWSALLNRTRSAQKGAA